MQLTRQTGMASLMQRQRSTFEFLWVCFLLNWNLSWSRLYGARHFNIIQNDRVRWSSCFCNDITHDAGLSPGTKTKDENAVNRDAKDCRVRGLDRLYRFLFSSGVKPIGKRFRGVNNL